MITLTLDPSLEGDGHNIVVGVKRDEKGILHVRIVDRLAIAATPEPIPTPEEIVAPATMPALKPKWSSLSKAYRDGEHSLVSIARETGLSKTKIRDELVRRGVKIRTPYQARLAYILNQGRKAGQREMKF